MIYEILKFIIDFFKKSTYNIVVISTTCCACIICVQKIRLF